MSVKIEGEKIKGIFLERINRFEALVLVDGEAQRVHVPNTGRMKELLHKGVEVTLVKSNKPDRKTKYSMMFVNKNGHLICINSPLANRVFEDGIRSGKINWLKGDIKREVSFRDSRIDFFIDGEYKTFVEVKCGTYEENGTTMFPDAPTERGRKHIGELIKAVEDGYRAAVVIVAFMDYVKEFTPNYKIDREFGEKLKEAYDGGIDVRAYKCSISEDEIYILEEIKVYF
ncbi:DNA/RNA nuclease SfsA [Fonticella tunisiensis]|uniref:Sugar fermentation stimulation protein homolog n=1 Tax=Fonticella tunisiensis TaxID=1096341 RepID=A0A4R7KRR1_9CLOT|nr:DNA/RNA nuclease SfsA [Fonticella tunisiensis]TDT61987.1 sugar fermentation stimulation protein A [Fonticella tunisiensis]